MAAEHINEIVTQIREKLSKTDLSCLPEKLAVQFNLTGRISGIFYIEVLGGNLSVEPYEYIDKDGSVSITITNLKKLIAGKLPADDSKISVEGNEQKVRTILGLFSN
ncbi:MAG: SCP-2 sterol transfer family protein [Oscillospiraceae bacterium]|nr:SCP-2 sterol transfer family protein [Oscillospiraceae bacterium]